MSVAKLEAADDGAFATRLAGADVVFRVSGAHWLPGERMLVVADLPFVETMRGVGDRMGPGR